MKKRIKKLLTIIGAVGQTASVVAGLNGIVPAKVAIVAGGVSTIATVLGKSILEFGQPQV